MSGADSLFYGLLRLASFGQRRRSRNRARATNGMYLAALRQRDEAQRRAREAESELEELRYRLANQRHLRGVAEARVLQLEEGLRELRAAFAYEARVVEAQALDVQSLSKVRRTILTEQVERMRDLARGGWHPRRNARGFEQEARALLDRKPEAAS